MERESFDFKSAWEVSPAEISIGAAYWPKYLGTAKDQMFVRVGEALETVKEREWTKTLGKRGRWWWAFISFVAWELVWVERARRVFRLFCLICPKIILIFILFLIPVGIIAIQGLSFKFWGAPLVPFLYIYIFFLGLSVLVRVLFADSALLKYSRRERIRRQIVREYMLLTYDRLFGEDPNLPKFVFTIKDIMAYQHNVEAAWKDVADVEAARNNKFVESVRKREEETGKKLSQEELKLVVEEAKITWDEFDSDPEFRQQSQQRDYYRLINWDAERDEETGEIIDWEFMKYMHPDEDYIEEHDYNPVGSTKILKSGKVAHRPTVKPASLETSKESIEEYKERLKATRKATKNRYLWYD